MGKPCFMEKSPLLKIHPAARVSDWSLMELKEINFKITLFRESNAWQASKTTQESGMSLVNSFSLKATEVKKLEAITE